MRILIATYASRGLTDMGVGRHFNQIADILERDGHKLIFFNHPTPLVVEKTTLKNTLIPMFHFSPKNFAKIFDANKFDAVHIQSEVGVGLAARQHCAKHSIPYSAAYHTNWDIGMKSWAHIPSSVVWSYLRWCYKPASLIHVSTSHAKQLLREKGIQNSIETFPLGVDQKMFYYEPNSSLFTGYPRPYFMTMSRISKEKNLEGFLDLSLPGTKFVIGNGPYKSHLEKKYHGKAVFLPYTNVRSVLSMGDVFVFPSRYDTFGLSILEGLACGLPIAAFPVMGPVDIIEEGVCGHTSENLQEAALACLSLKKEACIEHAKKYPWEKTAHEFLKHQVVL